MKILNLLKKIWTNANVRTFFMMAVIIVLIMMYWSSCEGRKEDKKEHAQNQEAIKKELTEEKNKNGELQTSIVTWEGKAKDLDNYSKDLAEELKAVKKSKVKVITKTVVKYTPADTVEIDNKLDSLGNNEYKLDWVYTNEDSARVLVGESRFFAEIDRETFSLKLNPGKTFVTKDEISLAFITGVKYNKKTGYDEIFVTPKSKNVTITSLEGAILNKPKKKKYTVAAGIGYGVGMDRDKKLVMTPTITIIIGKPFFSF